ncbi:MAG TPA: hypothetical protein VMA09_21680 [Candidatus Binataceae bacterium]|nr:hypothetical protein [Candidatus Binataceae bacterium]
MDSLLLEKIPQTVAGKQLRWYLERLISAGEKASLDDRANYIPELQKRIANAENLDDYRENWRAFAVRLGKFAQVYVETADEFSIKAGITTEKGHKWWLTVEVETQAPNRIIKIDWQRQVDFKLEVRRATEADAAALAEIERKCPIVLGDTSVYFDRGNDYFAFARLMEESTVGIAFVDNQPAAVSCGAMHRVRIGGVIRPIVTVAHLRVMPEHQRKGLWGAVNRAFDHYWKDVDGSNAYIAVNNAGMQHGFANTPNKWHVIVLRVQLPCAKLAGPPFGRVATPDDAGRIVNLVNAAHQREEMFVPYTVESLRARLERAKSCYSWDQILLTDRAVLGVWPAGDLLKVITETKGIRSVSRRALALDYGFLPGGEDDLEKLLRARCTTLAAEKIDTLSIFSSEPSPGCARLCSLGREAEPFNMWSPGIAEPADSISHGLYVDPIYF